MAWATEGVQEEVMLTETTAAPSLSLSGWVSQYLVAAAGRSCEGSEQSFVAELTLIAGDASPRKYYRVTQGAEAASPTLIAVESPPTEKNHEFLAIRQLLADGGVRVPALIAADPDRGYLLLEDLGDALLLSDLTDHSADGWYASAFTSLLSVVAIDPLPESLQLYDETRLRQEMDLLIDWFVPRLLDQPVTGELQEAFDHLASRLIENAQEQPQVLVHRDFHSRNLMVLPDGKLGVIDFQDAVVGPVTYDPVSLLKDCYIQWPRTRQLGWLSNYRRRLEACQNNFSVPEEVFVRWFDLMGLQRHIKVLGIFARLAFRDGKPDYLLDLPRVIAYVREALDLYKDTEPAVAAFQAVFEGHIMPICRGASWFTGGEDS
jgi:aminoglycoside/choline kinase family phosphotransferase